MSQEGGMVERADDERYLRAELGVEDDRELAERERYEARLEPPVEPRP